jgi:mannose-1-phosphate guanylyltransferase
MKAFLLAAGNGTRLRPLTDNLPKCLVPVRGVPMLQHWLELCSRSGITEVLINLHSHAGQVQEFLNRQTSPVKVRIFQEEVLLGSAGTIFTNREWIGAESAFWILYSDVLTNANLPAMAEFHAAHKSTATLGLYRVPEPSRCGIAITDENGVIVDFEEKPEKPRSNLAFSGIMMASPRLLDFVPAKIPADIGFDVLPHLTGKMMGYSIQDYLLDIGTIPNYQAAQQNWPGLDASFPASLPRADSSLLGESV